MSNQHQYRVGDIANGHVLTEQGWVPLPAPAQAAHAPGGSPDRPKRSWGKVVLSVVGGIVGLLLLIGVAADPVEDTDVAADPAPSATAEPEAATADAPTEAAPDPEPEPEATAEAPEPENAATVSQANALRAAESYLDTMAFSKAGLIDQLSSEYGSGFDPADAKWAVRQLDVDWSEQAVRAAESYLDTMAFSRQGLIDQLSSEYGSQFTKKQAVHAVDTVGL
jgi:hypothetical protein